MRKATFNNHVKDFKDYTIEFDVKNPKFSTEIPEQIKTFEEDWNLFINEYATKCFKEINKSNYSWLTDWSFAGRSDGWFVLIVSDNPIGIHSKSIIRITEIVNKYFDNFEQEFLTYYKNYGKKRKN